MAGRRVAHRGNGLQVGPKVAQVPIRHPGVGGVGEGGVVVPPRRRQAQLHGAQEVALGPAADAGELVLGDVGHDEGAEGRLQLVPAGQGLAVLVRMARGAAAHVENILAALRVGRGAGARVGGQRPD